MIEVTNEMLDLMEDWACQDEVNRHSAINYVFNIIKLHEANKPKPEPVAYTSRGELEDLFYQAEMKAFSDKSDINDMPLYTAPPTREPLSEDEIKDIIEDVLPHGTMGDLVRAIEKAHGIGVINENR